jgi:hypothetical protein
MFFALVIVKGLIELAVMFILGRAALGLLIGSHRTRNVFWQILDIAAKPALWMTRAISPRMVLARYIPVITLAWLLAAWLVVLKMKIEACLSSSLISGLRSCQ